MLANWTCFLFLRLVSVRANNNLDSNSELRNIQSTLLHSTKRSWKFCLHDIVQSQNINTVVELPISARKTSFFSSPSHPTLHKRDIPSFVVFAQTWSDFFFPLGQLKNSFSPLLLFSYGQSSSWVQLIPPPSSNICEQACVYIYNSPRICRCAFRAWT